MFSPSLAIELDALLLEALDRFRTVGVNRAQHLLGERLELVVLRDRLGLAADPDDRAAAPVDDEADEALGRRPARTLSRRRHAALAQQRAGALEIAVRLLERALAIHHPRARRVAELLDEGCADRGAHSLSPPSATARRLELGLGLGLGVLGRLLGGGSSASGGAAISPA